MQHPGNSRGLWTSVLVLQALGLPACSSTGSAEAISEAQVQQAVVTPLDDQVMRVVGRQLLDSNGVPFLTRGIEGWFGSNAQAHISTLVDGIASQGFNAVRLQLLTTNLGKIESLIKRIHAKNMVVYLVSSNMPIAEGVEWFGLAETQAMIAKNRRNMVIDATIEEWGDCESDTDTATWLNDQKVTITKFRNWGYTQPLTIGTLDQGRCLRALLDHGQELVDFDPLHSLVLNAQMYWGAYTSGFSYQEANGFSAGNTGIKEATAAVAAKPFLIQFGLDAKDSGGNWADVPYSLLMTEAQNKRIGTMWWQWKDPDEGDPNSLVTNQLDPTSLTPLGNIVINTHAKSIKKTSKTLWPCGELPGSDTVLLPGQSVTSCNGQWSMRVQPNPTGANLVLKYNSHLMGRVLMGAEDILPTVLPNPTFLGMNMQGDGNFVAYYDKNGVVTPTWASGTFGSDFYVQLTNFGEVRVASRANGVQWSSRTLFKPPAATSCGHLSPGEMLGGSEVSGYPAVLSCNGQFAVALFSRGTPAAADALYGTPTWAGNAATGSAGSLIVGAVSNGVFTRSRSLSVPRPAGRGPAVGAYMQGDGNLVIRDNLGRVLPGDDALWASNTNGSENAHMEITDDGTLRMVSATGSVLSIILNPP